MATFSKTKLALAISGSLTLAACGGGGTGSISIPTPGGSPQTFSFNFNRTTGMFPGAIQDLSADEQQQIQDVVTVFQFIDSHSLDAAKAQGVKVEFNDIEYDIDYVWHVLKGITNQYYTGKEEFWSNAATTGKYDDESAEYNEIQYYDVVLTNTVGNAAPNELDTKIAEHFYKVGTGEVEVIATPEPVEPIVVEPVAEEQPEATEEEIVDALEVLETVLSSDEAMSVSAGEPIVSEVINDDTIVTTDANGSTVTELWKIYYTTTTIPLTTTITTTTYKTVTYSDGTSAKEVVDTKVTTKHSEKVLTNTSRVLASRTVTANVKSTEDVDTSADTVVRGNATVTTTSVEDTREYLDNDGSTVTEVWTVYTDTTTVPVTTTTTITTTTYTTWTDGTVTSEVTNVTSSDTVVDDVSVANREELVSSTVTPNVRSTSTSQTSEDTVTRGDAVVTTTSVEETRVSADANGSTVTDVYTVYTDTTTVPVTTTTVVTDYRTTVYTDGTSITEPTNVTSTDVVTYDVTSANREELVSHTVTPNVASTEDVQTAVDTVTRGESTTTTTSVNDTRVSTDANGSTVTDVYAVYTDTTTTPVTTTTTVTTTRNTTWTDGTVTSEVVNVTATDVTVDETATATREELVSHTVTANVKSTEDRESASTTTTVSDPVLQETIVNTDTREDGVYTFFYDIWVTTTTVTTTTTTTRYTTWTDGTVTEEVVDVTTTENVTTDEKVTQRVQNPDTVVGDPEAPATEAGSTTVTQTGAPTLDYDPATYDAATYYNSPYMGTPTVVASNDPADHATVEADNGANLEVNANYAWARGWTGKGSTVMIMDTGIDTDHSEFEGKIKYQWEPGYDDGIEDSKSGHGTHVAGIVAAANDGVGMQGVAYDANLAIARVGERNASPSFARQALNWAKQYDDIVAANFSANYNYSTTYRNNMVNAGNGIFVSTDSIYNGSNYYNMEDPAQWGAALAGSEIVVTMSAGNQSIDYVQSPAQLAAAADADGNLYMDGRMLVVGNWNKTTNTVDGAKAGHICTDYSNGTCNDPYRVSDFYILAPGMQVNSTYNDGGYKNMSGTSMASPVVAGAVAIVHQLWPYMKGKNIAQLLLQTADKDLPNYSEVTHGRGLLDLDQATRPVGDLGISLTGRTGATIPVSGSLSANINTAALASVSAVDDFDRDFTLDLTPATGAKPVALSQSINASKDGWGASIANLSTKQVGNFRFGASEDTKDVTLGYTTQVSRELDLTLSYTSTESNPWVEATGMWGETQGSQTIDARVKYKFSKETYANLGLMNTTSKFNPGLVTNISDVQAVYAGAGYEKDGLDLYAGIKPYAVSGKLDLRIPTGVSEDGTMSYTESSSAIKSKLQGYASVNYTDQLDEMTSTRWSAGVDSTGEHSVGIQFTHRFW